MAGLSFPFVAGDAVAVFDSTFNQVFVNARPMKAAVHETSRLLDHPIETGQIITDYSIILPTEIQLPVIVMAAFYRDTYQEIKNLYLNKQLLTVQTRTDNYANMVIAEIPHEEDPDKYDALSMVIKFRQAQVVPALTTYAPADPNQANTVQAGAQNGYVITGVQTSDGVETISSIPPQTSNYTISGVQTGTGATTIPGASPTEHAQVTGVQTLTPVQTISRGFQ